MKQSSCRPLHWQRTGPMNCSVWGTDVAYCGCGWCAPQIQLKETELRQPAQNFQLLLVHVPQATSPGGRAYDDDTKDWCMSMTAAASRVRPDIIPNVGDHHEGQISFLARWQIICSNFQMLELVTPPNLFRSPHPSKCKHLAHGSSSLMLRSSFTNRLEAFLTRINDSSSRDVSLPTENPSSSGIRQSKTIRRHTNCVGKLQLDASSKMKDSMKSSVCSISYFFGYLLDVCLPRNLRWTKCPSCSTRIWLWSNAIP